MLFDFLVASKSVLKEYCLAQTCNFVDGKGWRDDTIGAQVGWQGNIVAFPYWEVWSLPIKEDRFFSKIGRRRWCRVCMLPWQAGTEEKRRQL